MGGLKVSVKHKDRVLSEREEWQDRNNHSSLPTPLHLHLLEGPHLSFWSSLGLLSVCTDTALREKKGLALRPPIHLGHEKTGDFLLLLGIWATGTQNEGLDANLF